MRCPGLTGGHGFPWWKVLTRNDLWKSRARAAIFPDRCTAGPMPGCRRGPGVSESGTLPRAASLRPRSSSCPHRRPVWSAGWGGKQDGPLHGLASRDIGDGAGHQQVLGHPPVEEALGCHNDRGSYADCCEKTWWRCYKERGQIGAVDKEGKRGVLRGLRCAGWGGCPGTCQHGDDGRRQGDYDAPHVSLLFVDCGRLDRHAWTSQKGHTPRMRSYRFLTLALWGPGTGPGGPDRLLPGQGSIPAVSRTDTAHDGPPSAPNPSRAVLRLGGHK